MENLKITYENGYTLGANLFMSKTDGYKSDKLSRYDFFKKRYFNRYVDLWEVEVENINKLLNHEKR